MQDLDQELGSQGSQTNEPDTEQRTPTSAKMTGSVVLDLVLQAADAIKTKESRAAEAEARAQSVVKMTLDKLHTFEASLAATERMQGDTNARIVRVETRIRDFEDLLEKSASVLEAARAELSAVRLREKLAEGRARDAENTLARVEDAIRTKIIMPLDQNSDLLETSDEKVR
jgi:hypothetical protein